MVPLLTVAASMLLVSALGDPASRVAPDCVYAGRYFSGSNGDYEDLSSRCRNTFGGAFSVAFTVVLEENHKYSRIFDFAEGFANNNLFVEWSDQAKVQFQSTQGGPWRGFEGWTHGLNEKKRYLVSIDASGHAHAYQDGILVSTADLDPLVVATRQLWLGRSHLQGTPFFKGTIEDFWIWHSVVSWDSAVVLAASTTSSITSSATVSGTTSSATVSGTTATVSGRATSYLQEPTCTATRMRCPVPAHAAGGYNILGSESVAGCSLRNQSTAAPFFDFAFGDCNASRTVDAETSLVQDTVTIVYAPPSFGSLVLGGGGENPAFITCTCQSPRVGVVSHGLATAEDRARGNATLRGTGEFHVVGSMHLSAAFDSPLSPGATLAPSAERLYLEMRTGSAADVLGVERCVAAPSDSLTDPYAVEYLAAGCPSGPLDLRTHAQDERHAVRISIQNFRFAGTTELYLWCRVVRCDALPCGECSSSRRLRGHRSLQGEEEGLLLAVGNFRTQRSDKVTVLPGPLVLAAAPLWEPPVGPAGSLLASAGALANLTLFASPLELSHDFLRELASSISQSTGLLLARDVTVQRILAMLAKGRRLSAAPGRSPEALVVECAIALESSQGLQRLDKLLQDVGFKRRLEESLQARGGWASPLRVAFGPLSWVAVSKPFNTETPLMSGQTERTSWVRLAVVAAVGMLLGCTCAFGLLQCYRHHKSTSLQPREKPLPKLQAEQDDDTVTF